MKTINDETQPSYEPKRMAPERDYYWVVLCKNHLHHLLQNRWMKHPILLGETDSVSPLPTLKEGFRAMCDDCGKEYMYHARDLLRFETEPRETFEPHPLFRQL